MKESLSSHKKIRPLFVDESTDICIDFVNVSFSYTNENYILKNVSFSLKPREKIAFVGANGAGKSTLIKLLCGFYAPTSGDILINGVSINHYDLNEWRNKISPVFQDFNSYSFSLEKNITMGLDLNNDKLDNAALKAGVREFSSLLPKGLNENLGRDFGGADLSKGQWQKVALARALYKDSPIYLLDEPTSSLDPLSEYEIFYRFVSATENKTVIFVTHRLSLTMMADRIFLFDKGELMQQGSHDNLIDTSDLYKKMFETQANNYLLSNQRATLS